MLGITILNKENQRKIMDGLFQEKVIRFDENANILITLLRKLPILRDKISDQWYGNQKSQYKIRFGILALFGTFLWEFFTKLVYGIIFIYIPYILLGKACPNILQNQELSMIYFFVIMSTFCGSFANPTLFTMSEKDDMMLKVMGFSSRKYYIGKILYKMFSDFIYFACVLILFGIGLRYSILLSLFTMTMRPVGEGIGLVIYEYAKNVHKKRSSIHGLIMSMAFIVAYVVPYVNRSISEIWYKTTNLFFVFGMAIIGFGAIYYLWMYKKYEEITQEVTFIRRENN